MPRHGDGIGAPMHRSGAGPPQAGPRGETRATSTSVRFHTVSETPFEVPGARVLARWGRLPAGATTDPSAIEPAPETSWVLDLDVSSAAMPFDVAEVLAKAEDFAARQYTIFRWAVTDEFLRRHGGAP